MALARIQAAIANPPSSETAGIGRTPVDRLPALYDELLGAIERRFPAGTLPSLAPLAAARPAVGRWAEDAAAGGWPLSINHLDLHPGNAVRLHNGRTLIFDWEEAELGFPFFALDKLLIAAEEQDRAAESDPIRASTQAAIRAAYLDELPWGSRAERERAMDLARLLTPIRNAHADLRFADALGWDPSDQVAMWMTLALRRWEASGEMRRSV